MVKITVDGGQRLRTEADEIMEIEQGTFAGDSSRLCATL